MCIQTEPSLMWLPFFLSLSLHLGQVPMGLLVAMKRRAEVYRRGKHR